jgi:hypothetical protein
MRGEGASMRYAVFLFVLVSMWVHAEFSATIKPINRYIKQRMIEGKSWHRSSTFADRAMLLKGDRAVRIFETHGWKWGGDFSPYRDYQHFAKEPQDENEHAKSPTQ